MLACPACAQLVHAKRLKALAQQAQAASAAGDSTAALQSWREALELLPEESKQHAQVRATILELSRGIDATSAKSAPSSSARGWWAGIGALLLFIVGKGKLLLLGLTKASTLFSMFLSLGVYWTAFGWKFAAGLVLSLYVHEMGHVAWLRRYGIAASAPMFVPGLGAFVRMGQYPTDAREDARIGLAGPTWGLFAALVFLAAGSFGPFPSGLAIAHVGAWINLFNLLPVWQLDGARGFRALSRPQRWFAAAAIGLAWALNGDGILLLLLGVAVWRACSKDAPAQGDRIAAFQYAALILGLGQLARVH